MSDAPVDDKPTPPVSGRKRPAGTEAGSAVVAPQKDNPARQEQAGPLGDLVEVERQTEAETARLRAAQHQAREKFRQATKPETTPQEESEADIQATVERAVHDQNEYEVEVRQKEDSKKEKKRSQKEETQAQLIEGFIALGEQAKQLQETNAVVQDKNSKGRKTTKPSLTLPVQFDYAKRILIGDNDQRSQKLPLRLADVVAAWFEKDPLNRKDFRLELTYQEIADLYVEGRLRRNAPKASVEEIQAKLVIRRASNPKAFERTPRQWATDFASDFTRWLKKCQIVAKDLFSNDPKEQKYTVNRPGWHATRPIINHAEATKRRLYKSQMQAGEGGGDEE